MADEQTSDKIKISIYMERDFHERIKFLASADARSVNSLVIKLLQDYTNEHEDLLEKYRGKD